MANDAYITILGNLVRDPEKKAVGENTLCSFTVAVSTDSKKSNDPNSYDSNFYDCTIWGEREAARFMQRCQKGTYVMCVGEFNQAEYQGNDGSMKHRLRLKVDKWKGLLRTKDNGGNAAKPAAATKRVPLTISAYPEAEDNEIQFD